MQIRKKQRNDDANKRYETIKKNKTDKTIEIIQLFYDEKDTVGKRYRRHDAIGTPYCVTVDHQSLQDNSVTIRNRDTMTQDRISINQLKAFLEEKVSMKSLLKKL